ncbi:MAG: hypothetical protein AB1650_01500 [Candidatus Omnitrophota bacterium]
MKKIFSFITLIQGVYYFITGLWPLFHYESFQILTGPKTDDWLAKTVGLLTAVIGLSLITGLGKKDAAVVIILAGGAALSFLGIDIFYLLNERLGKIYLLDAAIEAVFLAAAVYLFNTRSENFPYRFE